MLEVHKNIKKYRLEKGMSQTELAEKVGFKNKASISIIESGRNDLTPDKVVKFADALGVSPMQLLGWDKIEDVADTASSIINRHDELNDAFHDIRKKYDNSDDAGKKEIMTVLNLLRT